jgi:Nuclear RNA-splicing-associated protein
VNRNEKMASLAADTKNPVPATTIFHDTTAAAAAAAIAAAAVIPKEPPAPPTATDAAVDPAKQQPQRNNSSKNMTPMSRHEYEALQQQVRKVYDPESGRFRMIRGTGEVIECIVSRSEHEAINRQATRGDGSSYARHIFHAAASKK